MKRILPLHLNSISLPSLYLRFDVLKRINPLQKNSQSQYSYRNISQTKTVKTNLFSNRNYDLWYW